MRILKPVEYLLVKMSAADSKFDFLRPPYSTSQHINLQSESNWNL